MGLSRFWIKQLTLNVTEFFQSLFNKTRERTNINDQIETFKILYQR